MAVDVSEISKLSPRELELAQALNRGMSRKSICDAMGISSNTLQAYLGNIYLRLGITDGDGLSKQAQLMLMVERAKVAK